MNVWTTQILRLFVKFDSYGAYKASAFGRNRWEVKSQVTLESRQLMNGRI